MKIVNQAISTTFTLLNIRVANANLEDRITDVRDLIANDIAVLEFFNNRLNILVDAAIFFFARVLKLRVKILAASTCTIG